MMTTETRRPKRSRRTDPHRPGAIIPAHYEYALTFNLSTSQDGWPIPSFGINCELDRRTELADGTIVNGKHSPDGRCCTIGLRLVGGHRHALDGGPGKCTVCGAAYIYGDAWIHKPTGEIVFLGHDCADKYSLLADRSEHELALGRLRQAAAVQCERARAAEERGAFLAKYPGLEQALDRDHRILADLKARFTQYRALSEKQVALAHKIAAELDAPPAEREKNVPAPTGKQTFCGTVVSAKTQEGDWGVTYRMTVKVTTPEGVWLAWGTAPTYLLEQVREHGMGTEHGTLDGLRGCEVEVTATLQPGRDAHFAIMKRPRGELLATKCSHDDDCNGCLRERTGRLFPYAREVRDCRRAEVNERKHGFFDRAVMFQELGDQAERELALHAKEK